MSIVRNIINRIDITKISKHIASFQNYYTWFPIGIIVIALLGTVAQWLNHGHRLLDDPSEIYSYGFESMPILLALFWTSLFSKTLNNTYSREEWIKASWIEKLIDNAPEVIIFIVILNHYH